MWYTPICQRVSINTLSTSFQRGGKNWVIRFSDKTGVYKNTWWLYINYHPHLYRVPCSTQRGDNIPELLFPRTFLHPLPYPWTHSNASTLSKNHFTCNPGSFRRLSLTVDTNFSSKSTVPRYLHFRLGTIGYRDDIVTRFFDWEASFYALRQYTTFTMSVL